MNPIRHTRLAVLGAVASIAVQGAVAADAGSTRIERMDPALDDIIAPGTTIARVATGFKFTEGPMWRI